MRGALLEKRMVSARLDAFVFGNGSCEALLRRACHCGNEDYVITEDVLKSCWKRWLPDSQIYVNVF